MEIDKATVEVVRELNLHEMHYLAEGNQKISSVLELGYFTKEQITKMLNSDRVPVEIKIKTLQRMQKELNSLEVSVGMPTWSSVSFMENTLKKYVL